MLGLFNCYVERHSVTKNHKEIVSLVATYPRSILPEFNTHTVLSKNTTSSRAIPYSRKPGTTRKEGQAPSIREMVTECPYLPIYWGRNEAGMQATKELNSEEIGKCKEEILKLRDYAITIADRLWAIGLHKQDCNRYLEPWAWTTQIITGTEWSNFFALRTHKDAHPAFKYIARKMYVAYKKSRATPLNPGEWHLPFTDHLDGGFSIKDKLIASVARCARLSYNTHEGVRSFDKDQETYDKLITGADGIKHMSPFGHQGKVIEPGEPWMPSNLFGFQQFRKYIIGENIGTFEATEEQLLEWEVM